MVRFGSSERYKQYFRGGVFAVEIDGEELLDGFAERLLDGALEHDQHVVLLAGASVVQACAVIERFRELTDEKAIRFEDGDRLPCGLIYQTEILGRSQIRQIEAAGGDAADRCVLALVTDQLAEAEKFGLYVAATDLGILIGLCGEHDPVAVAKMHRAIERRAPGRGRGLHFDPPRTWPAPGRTS